MHPNETFEYWYPRFIVQGYPPAAAMVYARERANACRVRREADERKEEPKQDIRLEFR
jgi:hypothetical protein